MIQFKNHHCCVFESALFKTTSTVIWTPDLVVVVDPTWLPDEVATIRRFVDDIKADRPVYLLFTHSDYDHILGYGAFPEAKVIASEAFVHNKEKSEVLDQIRKFDHDYYIDRPYDLVYPQVDEIISKDGQTIKLGQTELLFYLAPGHNPDGIFTIVSPLHIWLSGDYLADVEFPYIYHSVGQYQQSLDKAQFILETYHPGLLIPGHGNSTSLANEMADRIRESRDYLRALEDYAQNDTPFPEDKLWQRYSYKLGMASFHEKNLELAKKELGH